MQLRRIESLKPGPPLEDDARDWYSDQLAQLAVELGPDTVAAAIERCLLDSRFRPDISEIRRACGVASDQSAAVAGATAWVEMRAILRRFATTDDHGKWVLRSRRRIVRNGSGAPVYTTDERNRPVIATEPVTMPMLNPQAEWCLEQVGGLHRLMECQDDFVEVIRKEFLRAWPLYRAPAQEARLLAAGDEERVDVDAMIRGALQGRRAA